MARWGFALTTKEIKNVVADFVSENNITTPFNSKTGRPGKDWMTNFLRRHNLSIRNLEKLEMNRRIATADPFIIYKFYDLLEEVITYLNIGDKPLHIYNLDETYLCSDPVRLKCVAGKGQKAHRNVQGSGKDNTSILACCSASGKLLSPLIIFPGQHLWTSWKGKHDIKGTFYASSVKGYMTSVIFQDWFVKFCSRIKETFVIGT